MVVGIFIELIISTLASASLSSSLLFVVIVFVVAIVLLTAGVPLATSFATAGIGRSNAGVCGGDDGADVDGVTIVVVSGGGAPKSTLTFADGVSVAR